MLNVHGRVPRFLRNSEVVICPYGFMKELCPRHMLVKLDKGCARILVHNNSDRIVRLKADQAVAAADLKSIGSVWREVWHVRVNEKETVFFCDGAIDIESKYDKKNQLNILF